MTRQADKIRVFGGTHQQAKDFIRALMLNPDEYIAAFDAMALRGVRNCLVIFVGSFRDRPDYVDLMQEIMTREHQVLAKITDW